MRSILILAFAILPALSVAQRGGGGGGRGGFGGGGGFPHGGGNAPNTFITVASAAPAAATSAAAPPAATPPAAAPPAATGGGGAATGGGSGAVDASLIPPYGITPGVKSSDGTANCAGDNGKNIPCTCPPPVNNLVTAIEAQVANGLAFPSGTSQANQLTRLNTAIIALQNVNGGPGSGVGCPIVSTTWTELRASLQ
ncbi:hypothetical protein H2200_013492 [Cladophialophora chaetospira]|uniref:Hydrophobin n=1 Tax=Cladophialophora chaetospira TaxID=386627 RepID=A0AA38UE46_9EURO|nr:hypothetical protein H2200_013492 [Cladophialophora chaetospira]